MTSPESPPEHTPNTTQVRRTWLIKSLAVLILVPAFLVGSLDGGKIAWHWWMKRKLDALNQQAEDFYTKRNIEAAVRALRDVMRDHPLDERGLRLWARILNDSPHHNPEDAVAVWRKICDKPHATLEDDAALGAALLHANHYQEAKIISEHLSAQKHRDRAGLELEAALLRYEGRAREADQMLRHAYEADPASPDSRLKLAALDLTSPFPEIQARAAQTAWEIARSTDRPMALSAMQTLAAAPGLTVTQAQELRDRLGQMHDVTGAPRYAVLGGCLKALPLQRTQILDEEAARHQGTLGEESVEFLHWLLKNGENSRILTLVDKKTALHSSQLLPIYAEALNAAGRWKELQDLLHSSRALPLSNASVAIMLACCSYKLGEPRAGTLDHLKEALHHAHSAKSLPETFAIAVKAEEMDFNNLAIEAFTDLSGHRSYRLSALDHILKIRHRQGNLAEIIATLEALLKDTPGLAPYEGLFCYHKILAGEEMEKTAAIARQIVDSSREVSPTLHLALALAAYRGHDFKAAQREANAISSTALPAGQRAVLAGILQACGRPDAAFQLAEKIPPRLLLKEETRFLKGAL